MANQHPFPDLSGPVGRHSARPAAPERHTAPPGLMRRYWWQLVNLLALAPAWPAPTLTPPR